MLRKNSIFIKILIPILVIMILQPILISVVLFVYGITRSLDESAIESISNSAVNRNLVLTDKMVTSWSSLDRFEFEVINTLDDFINDERLLLTNIIGNDVMETRLLDYLSEPLINALRQTTATGAFIYFGNDNGEEVVKLNGLYYHKPDPFVSSLDNSDLLLLRGSADIARKNRIVTDEYWQEMFSFSPEDHENWRTFIEPQMAASQNRYLPSSDLAYWNNTAGVITYTRPVIYEGRVVAMIGTEVKLNYLERYLPANDFTYAQCGYMLIKYDNTGYEQNSQEINGDMLVVTGDYISALTESMESISFGASERQNIFNVKTDGIEPMQVAIEPLGLYSALSPFNDEQWAIAALGTDQALFEMSRMLRIGILLSATVTLAIGTLLLWVIIRRTAGPLVSIAGQIQENDPSEHIKVDKSNTYEISLLCDTINTMKDERSVAEAELRTERERYLVALESVADTVIEYDISEDTFIMYYFDSKPEKPELRSNILSEFTQLIKSSEFCHEDDIDTMLSFFKGETVRNVEVRIKIEVFSHITDTAQDNGYYWFFIKSSRLHGDNGELQKIIGTAREFTERRLRELAKIESARRDPITKLYKHEYGVNLTKAAVNDALRNNRPFSLSIISFNNFDEFEAHYGRVFAASILMELFFAYPASEKNITTRLSNDEVLLFINNADKAGVKDYADMFFEGVSRLYTGDNNDLHLNVSIGTVLSNDAGSFDELIKYAYKAVRYMEKNEKSGIDYYTNIISDSTDDDPIEKSKPINISLDVAKGNISNYTFELFESSADTHSAVNMLISVLGRIYSLRQILICAYDTDFGAGRVTHEWNSNGISNQTYVIEKISRTNWSEFESMLDKNGSLLYTGKDAEQYSPVVRQLLHEAPGEHTGGYCCVMYENGIPFGRMLFHTSGNAKEWLGEELRELYEVTKIIAVNLSNEKSTSASRAKSEFLSRISHEIRTPMNAIIGMTNIAKNSIKNTVRLTDSLDKIDFSAKHLLSLITNVLEMSRIESGKMEIENNFFSLVKFTRDIDKLMRPSIEENKINFEIINDISDDNMLIGDEYKLRQVIINLLGNANKFTHENGLITFTIKELEKDEKSISLYFSVKDNGTGIAPEDQPGIFKTFEQARSSSSEKKQQGSGLGLAISSSIITAMGGSIALESKPGEGSNFYFSLKFETEQDKTVNTEDANTSAYYRNLFTGKNALIVDDVDINVEVARFILEEVGFNIDIATNGQEAVDKFLSSDTGFYDIIIMDIQMPVMDGLTATRNIRKNSDRNDAGTVPIVAMTANAFDEDLKESVESGMNGHITKPIDVDIFHQLLYTVLLDNGLDKGDKK